MRVMNQNIIQKEYEYNALMDMMHVSVSKHLLDEHFTMVWANEFYYEMIDYTKAEYEALYHNLPDLYYREDPEEWNKLCDIVKKTMSEGEKSYRFLSRMRRRGGEHIWVQIASTFADEYIDGCQVSYTVITDVTETIRIQTEQSVTYENLPGFVGKFRINKDLDFTLLDANRQFVRFFGEGCWENEKDSLFSRNIKRNAEAIGAQRTKLLAGEPVHFTVQMEDQNGDDAWLQINAACVEYQDSCPVYLAIYIDITDETELRRMQLELEKALELAEQASRAKSDFLSHISHDIRTPMNAIIGMTSIAQSHLEDTGKVRDCLRKISLSSQHLLGLINDVLDMSRIESGKMTVSSASMSLPELLENVVAIIQPSLKARNQKFAVHLRNVHHEWLLSDQLRMRQIFLNILSNASKFTPVGGNITVEVEEFDDTRTDWTRFCFTFTDSGIGMKPEFVEHLFDPFSREQDSRVDKTEGSGLGMAITKKLVELLDGVIEVQSTPGEGTAFCVTLPLQIEETPRLEQCFPNLNVIVVDDDDVMCEYMDQALNCIGVHVDTARSGPEALELLALGRTRYDAVFLDWKMPGMDGPETAQRIRDLTDSGIPIVIVSAYDWSDIEEEAMAAGVNGFLSKPLFASTLCHALTKYVVGMAPQEENGQQAGTAEFSGRHFLLVEDNELNREIAEELLSDEGATVEWAGDGAQGAEKFLHSPEGYYDLILMDIQMPVMNGYDAARKIRAMNRPDAAAVPIVAMTADAFAEDVARAMEAGMNSHLAKPLDIAQLKREINRVLTVS